MPLNDSLTPFEPRVAELAHEFAAEVGELFPDAEMWSVKEGDDHRKLIRRPQYLDESSAWSMLYHDKEPGIAAQSSIGIEARVPLLDVEPRSSTLVLGQVTLVTVLAEMSDLRRKTTITTQTKQVGMYSAMNVVAETKTEVREDDKNGQNRRSTQEEVSPYSPYVTDIREVEDMFGQMRLALRLGKALEDAGVTKYLLK